MKRKLTIYVDEELDFEVRRIIRNMGNIGVKNISDFYELAARLLIRVIEVREQENSSIVVHPNF